MSVVSNVERFWNYFEDHEEELIDALKEHDYSVLGDLIAKISERAYRISGARFFIEDNPDQLEMTFDTGPNKTSQYITDLMVKMAPDKIYNRWLINSLLPPLSQKAIEAQVQIKDQVYTLTDFTVFYTVHPKQQMISALLYCPGFSLIGNPEYKKEMAMYLIETSIGQLYYEAYLSSIDAVDTPPEEDMKACNLVDFFQKIDNAVVENHWKEYKSALDIYSVYQPTQDFAHDALRKDMKIIFTTHPLLAEETLGDTQDVLMDLQAKEGEYGYIYYSNPLSGKDNALFRQELSKKMDDEISKIHAGRVIGGAMGKSFAYIDWIIFDKEEFLKAFEQVQKQLKDQVELHYRSFTE